MKFITKKRLFNILYVFLISGLTLLISITLDRLVGYVFIPRGYVYGPNFTIHYNSPEFNYSSFINKDGYRDKLYKNKKTNTIRVLLLGDSFTYGWGVSYDKIWSTIAENSLNNKGYKIELINLGRSGSFSKDYLSIARRTIDVFKPDHVFVCMLQGDDVMQMYSFLNADKKPNTKSIIKRIAVKLFPNFIDLVNTNTKEIHIKEDWLALYRELLSSASKEELAKMNQLPASLQHMYKQGELNPFFLQRAIRQPDYFIKANQLSDSLINRSMYETAKDVYFIKRLADEHQALTHLVVMPHKFYINKRYHHTFNEMGFDTTIAKCNLALADTVLKKIATKAAVSFVSFTPDFINASDSTEMYYTYDAHFNEKGNALFAKCIEAYILKNIFHHDY